MQIGSKINQLRKMAGMTQEQFAEKLNVSRQTISKWESGITQPDLESIIKISSMFQVTLDDLLLDEASKMPQRDEQLTLEDLIKIQTHNRKMLLLLLSSLIFLMMSTLSAVFIRVLSSITNSIEYMLYRYIAVGEYAYIPVDYRALLYPSAATGAIGILLFLWYIIENHVRRKKKDEI